MCPVSGSSLYIWGYCNARTGLFVKITVWVTHVKKYYEIFTQSYVGGGDSKSVCVGTAAIFAHLYIVLLASADNFGSQMPDHDHTGHTGHHHKAIFFGQNNHLYGPGAMTNKSICIYRYK